MKEYQKLLRVDPSDTNILLKIGDLHLKTGKKDLAGQTYSQAAEQFAKSGFDAKAVAIYKQMLRTDPSCLEAHIRLGDLFQRLGLAGDALREFQKGIELCEQRQLKREAFDLLKRVASLDPGNIANRLRLAGLLVRQSLKSEAREEFESLLEEVTRAGESEDIVRVADQILVSFPDHSDALIALGRGRVALGEIDVAIEKLSAALPNLPEDIPVREALVYAFEEANDSAGVQRVYGEIAELYKRQGNDERAREILQRFVPVDPFSEPDTAPSIILSEAMGEDDDSLKFDFKPPTDPGKSTSEDPSEESVDDLLAEACVSLEFGDMQGAQDRLDTLMKKHPDAPQTHELLVLIRGKSGAEAAKVEPESNESAPESPAASPSSPTEPPQPEEPAPFDTAQFVEADTLPDIELMLEDDFDKDPRYASIEPPPELLELDIDLGDSPAEGAEPAAGEDSLQPEPVEADPSFSESSSLLAGSAQVTEDLEEAEFFFQQGMMEEAERAYREILSRVPHHPKAMLRMGEISQDRGQGPGDDVAPLLEAETLVIGQSPGLRSEPETEFEPDSEPELPGGAEEGVFDLAAELDSGSGDDRTQTAAPQGFTEVFRAFKQEIQQQIGDEDSQAHYDLAIAYKEMGLLDDAVEELEVVKRAGQMPLISFAQLLATCYMGLQQPRDAATILEESLSEAGDDPEAILSLRYALGEAWAAAREPGAALEAFKKVAAFDPDYRDVRAKLADRG